MMTKACGRTSGWIITLDEVAVSALGVSVFAGSSVTDGDGDGVGVG